MTISREPLRCKLAVKDLPKTSDTNKVDLFVGVTIGVMITRS